MSIPRLQMIDLDGKLKPKVECPLCGVWAYIDPDQYHGKGPIRCGNIGCGYHATHDFANFINESQR